ncbi:MAG: LysM peptidoglycan-binding domain-containing protein, partial [Pseudomonadota bacterium]
MRSKNLLTKNPSAVRGRAKVTGRMFLFLAAGTVLSACSNDAIRFEEALTTGSIGNTSNQTSIIYKKTPGQRLSGTSPADQPYPGDVDTSVTGSIQQTRSGIRVAKRGVSGGAPTVARAALPKLSTPAVTAPSTKLPRLAASAYKAPTYAAPTYVAPKVSKPSVSYRAPNIKPTTPGIAALPPRGGSTTDNTVTGSVRSAATPPPAPVNVPIQRTVPTSVPYQSAAPKTTARPSAGSGWTKAGGTWVTVGQGETLYNLSRRYGVPVRAISKANNITDPSKVASGTKVLIPTYSFSSSAPISAPDSDPQTKIARATRGNQGQVISGRVAVPTARTRWDGQAAAAAPTALPKPLPVRPTQQASASASGSYVVKSGDTLYGISRSTGTSVSAIKSANGMSGDTVRVGQRLALPSGAQQTAQLDTTITGSVPKTGVEKRRPSVQSPAPKATSSAPKPQSSNQVASATPSTFRWPLKGRVVARFGEKLGGNTNDGIDIAVPVGSSVRAARGGKVIYAGSELEDFGQLILLSHSGGWVSAYAHASKTLVKRGD